MRRPALSVSPTCSSARTLSRLYAEDTWKVTPKLTMNIGLRYEYTPPFQDRYRGVFNVQMFCPGVDETGIDENCQTPIQVRPGDGPVFEGMGFRLADFVPVAAGDDVLFNHALVQRDTNDFAPRLGFAYQMDDKTTIRTGYGIYYAQDTGNPIFDMGRNFGARQSARSNDVFAEVNVSDPLGGHRSRAVLGLGRSLLQRAVHVRQRRSPSDALRAAVHVERAAAGHRHAADRSGLLRQHRKEAATHVRLQHADRAGRSDGSVVAERSSSLGRRHLRPHPDDRERLELVVQRRGAQDPAASQQWVDLLVRLHLRACDRYGLGHPHPVGRHAVPAVELRP